MRQGERKEQMKEIDMENISSLDDCPPSPAAPSSSN